MDESSKADSPKIYMIARFLEDKGWEGVPVTPSLQRDGRTGSGYSGAEDDMERSL
jgi:predicted CoA-binding protein